ncbi:uncharacterized protein LOC120078744 isoform X1 [Benincasa hispida]|uniref:uncharacterized protein LOC120078744 isoform X1 n=1 Tax=Benincasa hispida TaxID=102211 RepID=UPI0019009B3A|nr:uncharacterized protein LOC120078744 isoform X1 [Benincasa hispida]
MADKKPTMSEIVPMVSKVSEHKLNGSNYYSWRSNPGGVVCYYCHKPGYTKRECRRLLNKGQRMPLPSAHVASTPDNLDKSIMISAGEFAKFQQYQESLRASSSTPITTIVETGSYDETDYW